MTQIQQLNRWLPALFVVLCGTTGSRWLLDAALPSQYSAVQQCFLRSLVLAVAFAWPASRQLAHNQQRRILLYAGGLGFLVLWLPALTFHAVSAHVDLLTALLTGLGTPVLVVFLMAQRRPASTGSAGLFSSPEHTADPWSLLLPAIAGLAGAALLLPFTVPPSILGRAELLGLLLLAGLVAYGIVRLHGLLQHMRLLEAGFSLLLTSLLVVSGVLLVRPAPWPPLALQPLLLEIAKALLWDGPLLLLSLYLLQKLTPPAFAAVTVLTLLVTLVESFVLTGPRLSWTVAAGFLMMATSAGILFRQGGRLPR